LHGLNHFNFLPSALSYPSLQDKDIEDSGVSDTQKLSTEVYKVPWMQE